MRYCDIHMRPITQERLKVFIIDFSLKYSNLRLQSLLLGAIELLGVLHATFFQMMICRVLVGCASMVSDLGKRTITVLMPGRSLHPSGMGEPV